MPAYAVVEPGAFISLVYQALPLTLQLLSEEITYLRLGQKLGRSDYWDQTEFDVKWPCCLFY